MRPGEEEVRPDKQAKNRDGFGPAVGLTTQSALVGPSNVLNQSFKTFVFSNGGKNQFVRN
jgi:hypothetical protein